MAVITDVTQYRLNLANDLYEYALNYMYGLKICKDIDLIKITNQRMAIAVLQWNNVNNYLTVEQIRCLTEYLS